MTILRTNTIAGIGETFGPLLDGDLEFNSQNYIILPKGSSNQQGVLRTTEDVIGVGGTYYDNLVLAMPFNEATGLRDVSSRNRNPAAYGNVAISTVQSKYYGSSAYFDGSGDYIDTIEGSNDFDFEGDFTVEFWVYFNTINSYQDIVGTATNSAFLGSGKGGWVAAYYTTPDNEFRFSYQNNSSWTFQNAFDFNASVDTWYHVTYTREGSNLRCFVNGTQAQSTISTVGILTSTEGFVRVGGGYGSTLGLFDGHLQDFRIYKGIAKYTANFTPPERIAETGVGFKTGALRYNTDSNKPELYDGSQWAEVQSSRPDLNGGARGVFGGGLTPSPAVNTYTNVIEYVTISSTGNAIDFGDITTPTFGTGSCASTTRGVLGGGNVPGNVNVNVIEYVTISSTGNAADFGDLTQARRGITACSSSTRGIIAGNFSSPAISNIIEFVTISTLGNAFDFGDLTQSKAAVSSCSNSTRGLFAGGIVPASQNTIEFITISTTGNAQDFGDLTQARYSLSSCSSPIRGVFSGGAYFNIIDYVTIMSAGNAIDFGDLLTTAGRGYLSACSNAHGGL